MKLQFKVTTTEIQEVEVPETPAYFYLKETASITVWKMTEENTLVVSIFGTNDNYTAALISAYDRAQIIDKKFSTSDEATFNEIYIKATQIISKI